MTVSDTSTLTAVLGMQQNSLQQSFGMAAMRQQIQQDKAVAQLVAEVATTSAPAPGTGLLVDRQA
jgi:hypothetical protein